MNKSDLKRAVIAYWNEEATSSKFTRQYFDEIKVYRDLRRDKSRLKQSIAYFLACLVGYYRCGWFLTFEVVKN